MTNMQVYEYTLRTKICDTRFYNRARCEPLLSSVVGAEPWPKVVDVEELGTSEQDADVVERWNRLGDLVWCAFLYADHFRSAFEVNPEHCAMAVARFLREKNREAGVFEDDDTDDEGLLAAGQRADDVPVKEEEGGGRHGLR